MSIINKGTSFANGEQLTADKINDLIDLATFNQDATDSQTTDVNSAGQIVVNQGGIDTAQLATGAVTKSKIENVANMKALGNTSGSAASPQEVAILDEDTMSSDSDTSLATQQSIKAYANAAPLAQMKTNNVSGASVASDTESITLPNGLIIKTGFASGTGESVTVNFGTAFPNAVISVQLTQVGGTTSSSSNVRVNSISNSSLVMYSNTGSGVTGNYWQVIGR